jgi:hypothetical protein
MKRPGSVLVLLLLAAAASARASDPPLIEHQPVACTVPDQPISLCASISDDGTVAKARLYFRKAGEDYYSFVDMAFQGLNYCGTVPAPREGKVKILEYYVQAVDDEFQPQRTSTFQMAIQPEGVCEFPPLEKDAQKASSIRVFASNRKQGNKLPGDFVQTGVTFVPVAGK